MASLPVELWQSIVGCALDDLPSFSTPPAAPPTRPRTALLASLSLVCTASHSAVRDELFRAVAVTSEKQLRRVSALLEATPARAALPTSLEISWTAGSGGLTKREGAKKWRAAVVRFTKAARGLRRFSLRGPLPSPQDVQERQEEPYFDPGWLEEVSHSLVEMSLARIRLATFEQVAHVHFPALDVLRLEQCTDQDDVLWFDGHFREHFSPLKEFHLVDLEGKRAAVNCTSDFSNGAACSPRLCRLTLPCFALSNCFSPRTPRYFGYLHLPSTVDHLTLIDDVHASRERFRLAGEIFEGVVEDVVYLLSSEEERWSFEDKVREINRLHDEAQGSKTKIEVRRLEDFYLPFPEM